MAVSTFLWDTIHMNSCACDQTVEVRDNMRQSVSMERPCIIPHQFLWLQSDEWAELVAKHRTFPSAVVHSHLTSCMSLSIGPLGVAAPSGSVASFTAVAARPLGRRSVSTQPGHIEFTSTTSGASFASS